MTKLFLDSLIGLGEVEATDIVSLEGHNPWCVESGNAIPMMIYVNTVIMFMKDGVVESAEPGNPDDEE